MRGAAIPGSLLACSPVRRAAAPAAAPRCSPAAALADGQRPPRRARPTLLLDFPPNAVHAGHLHGDRARLRRGRGRRARGPQARAPRPTRSSCSRPAAPTWRSSTSTTSGSRASRAHDVVGVMAFVQRPLAAVLAAAGGRARRADLEGERVGVTGLPSDDAVLRSVVRGDGGDPGAVRPTTIGFQAVKALLARARRRRDRVLERRGRRAAAPAARHPRVPRRRVRRAAPTPSSCSP